MISKVGAGNSAYLQNSQETKKKKGTDPVIKSKKLDKIEVLKETVKSGDYKIDIDKTAQSVVETLV